MLVPCGKCKTCRINYSNMWALRMVNELRYHKKAVFVTMTYKDECLPVNKSLEKKNVQSFFKILRKNTRVKIRYFAVGEYGEENFRPHYHAIIYGLSKEDAKEIERAWTKGWIHCGFVSSDSCRYVAKYLVKKNDKGYYKKRGICPPFSLMSKRPGIGEKFAKEFLKEYSVRGHMYLSISKVGVPRYYREKFYDEKMKMERQSMLDDLSMEERKKSVEKINVVGYNEFDKMKLREREGMHNKLIGNENTRRGKI